MKTKRLYTMESGRSAVSAAVNGAPAPAEREMASYLDLRAHTRPAIHYANESHECQHCVATRTASD